MNPLVPTKPYLVGPIPSTILSGLNSRIEQHRCSGLCLYRGIGFDHHDVLSNFGGNNSSMSSPNICDAHCITFESDKVSQVGHTKFSTYFCQQSDTQSISTVNASAGVCDNDLQDAEGPNNQVIVFLCLDNPYKHSLAHDTRKYWLTLQGSPFRILSIMLGPCLAAAPSMKPSSLSQQRPKLSWLTSLRMLFKTAIVKPFHLFLMH